MLQKLCCGGASGSVVLKNTVQKGFTFLSIPLFQIAGGVARFEILGCNLIKERENIARLVTMKAIVRSIPGQHFAYRTAQAPERGG